MNENQRKQLDKATRAMLSMGSVPKDSDASFTKKDLSRRFRMRADRKGRGRVEELTD